MISMNSLDGLPYTSESLQRNPSLRMRHNRAMDKVHAMAVLWYTKHSSLWFLASAVSELLRASVRGVRLLAGMWGRKVCPFTWWHPAQSTTDQLVQMWIEEVRSLAARSLAN